MFRKRSQLTDFELEVEKKFWTNTLNSIPNDKFALYNGTNLKLRHCYGAFQKPIHSNIWFVNEHIVAFIISNYIALHNISKETTKYVGINKVVGEVTSFYICPNKEISQDTSESIDDDKDETHLIGYAEAPREIRKRI